MAIARQRPTSVVTLLKLGRVSNLPTVWTNVLAAAVLANGSWRGWRITIVLVAMTLFYIGGMYLNDYFDRALDAEERPERPIPSGEISAAAVAAIGYGLLATGVGLLAITGFGAAVVGLLLALVIVGYDQFHKGVSLAPVVMGACRALVYLGTAVATAANVPIFVASAALALLAYVAGLTYAARQESLDRVGNLWPLALLAAPLVVSAPALVAGPVSIALYGALAGASTYAVYLLARRPKAGAVSHAVGVLIAAISLVDAAFLASIGATVPGIIAATGFIVTLALQRLIAGT